MTVWSCWGGASSARLIRGDKHPTIFSENPHLQILLFSFAYLDRSLNADRNMQRLDGLFSDDGVQRCLPVLSALVNCIRVLDFD
jgi:hypothetical protein